jgi:hypothetical protein
LKAQVSNNVHQIRDVIKGCSLIGLGLVNPMLGSIGYGIMKLLEQPELKQTVSNKIRDSWMNLLLPTRRKIVAVATISSVFGMVLIGAMLIPRNNTKGGFDPEIIFPRPTRIIGKNFDIPVHPDFCSRIFMHYYANSFAKNFKIPTGVNMNLIVESIILLNKKFANGEPVNMILDQVLYTIMILCSSLVENYKESFYFLLVFRELNLVHFAKQVNNVI